MSGSTLIITVVLYVILSLLSDLTHAIELFRVKNKYNSLGVDSGLIPLPPSYAGCLEILRGTNSWSRKGQSWPVMG